MKWKCTECHKEFHVEGQLKCPKCGSEKLDKGAANATINRELSALRRMLNLGAKQTPRRLTAYHIPMLKENNIRKGFFEHNEYLALWDALPAYLKPFVTFAYKFGWRDEEIADLTWSQVDRQRGIVTLEAGESKNDDARTVYLDDELKETFDELWKNRKRNGILIPNVFPNEKGDGPIVNFRKAWNAACRKAGLGYGYKIGKKYVAKWQGKLPSGPILHDFRRTAVRNMIRSGIPERVAMLI